MAEIIISCVLILVILSLKEPGESKALGELINFFMVAFVMLVVGVGCLWGISQVASIISFVS